MSAPLARAAAASRRAAGLQAAALVALVALVYARPAASLARTWATNENYSHGPLVPLVSAFLVWRRRDALRALAPAPDARGLALVALACAMDVLGVRADLFALQGWSFPVLLAGLALTFLGPAHLRRLAFPIAFLGFMLTFPPAVMNQLSYGLKEVAVRLATASARACGVPLQRSGMSIFLETGELRVENPCSGLRSLLALVATGTLFAYLDRDGWPRRAALVAASVPLAILGNATRLWLLVVAAHYRDVAWATGRFHDVAGYALYAVALAGLFAVRAWVPPRRARAEAA